MGFEHGKVYKLRKNIHEEFPGPDIPKARPLALNTSHSINWPTPLISIPRRVFRLNANDKGNHHNAKQCERYKAISFVGKMAIYTAHRAEVVTICGLPKFYQSCLLVFPV